ncbi:MAG: SIS domain-containing protein [Nitrospinae bacterium]|nr:SIS domain-containing protein [Nitrospinota bacterium]
MQKLSTAYFNNLKKAMDSMSASRGAERLDSLHDGIAEACGLVVAQTNAGKKLMFIGNGASASISSHMSTDFWKNGGMRAVAFNDSSVLTCIGNDYGFKHLFEKPIEMFAEEGDVLVAISSSGKSENIIRGVDAARAKKCKVITLSGFVKDNPLSKLGDVNFYVPDSAYGPVEILHTAICHCILDVILAARNG